MEEKNRNSLQSIFEAIKDPRVERTKQHQLLNIIIIAILGVLCGADGWVDIESFGKTKEAWLKTFLDLPNGIPSHDTFGRVFARIDPKSLEACFLNWVRSLNEKIAGVIAIDGKTLRRSHDGAKGKKALHLVSAWASENRLVLAQVAVNEKSNEITAIPELLQLLALEGCIVRLHVGYCEPCCTSPNASPCTLEITRTSRPNCRQRSSCSSRVRSPSTFHQSSPGIQRWNR